MRVARRNNELNDVIEALDAKLLEAKGDIPSAWELVQPDELEYIERLLRDY